MNALSLDTESTYSKERDIRKLGVMRYVNHPETHHYLASAVGDDAQGRLVREVNEPEQFPWGVLDGAHMVNHNAGYDTAVLDALRKRGLTIPQPRLIDCSADLVAFLQAPRALAQASEILLGVKVSKALRAKMKGKEWNHLSVDQQQAVAKYCLSDAEHGLMLWNEFSRYWPEHEREASRHTRLMCQRGIAVDMDRVVKGMRKLARARLSAAKRVPWHGRMDEDGDEVALTSPEQVVLECANRGIDPPPCTDAKSEEFMDWLALHEGDADFILAIQEWRKANRLYNVLKSVSERQIDGVLSYSLKYFGAQHTGRWAGDAGLNMHNFPRKPHLGVDARACLVPRLGKRLIVADYDQIEARVSLWLAQDEAMLSVLRQGMDLYEAHARKCMGYTDPRPLKDVDPNLRQFAKCRVLGLGFGLGSSKFVRIVKQWTGMDITEKEAKNMVADFRRTNPKILDAWAFLETNVYASKGGVAQTILPSGRIIEYFDIRQRYGHRWTGQVIRGGLCKNLYGGLLFENLVQATARDLLAAAILRVENAGIPVVLHVHDEIVAEVDEADAEDAKVEVTKLMSQDPGWADGLPISCTAEIRTEYGK